MTNEYGKPLQPKHKDKVLTNQRIPLLCYQ